MTTQNRDGGRSGNRRVLRFVINGGRAVGFLTQAFRLMATPPGRISPTGSSGPSTTST
ncbi:MAG: hypothetical protein IPK58_16955 [Acidobacteria bacterium]|nr:hypothetical protein [Acidobacteriota bacterium]